MTRLLLLASLCMLAMCGLFAQAPGPVVGANTGGSVLLSTPKALFVLRAGVLGRLNPTTLATEKVFQLFGPAPEPPAQGSDRAAMQKYFEELQRRNAPALLLAKDNALLIVVGDGFARLNQDTLKVEATADLRAPEEASAGRGTREAPGYLLQGNTLLLLRGKEMLSLSITDGKILARAPLPKELQPLQMQFNVTRGGGDNRGGGDGRGGR